jgi:hypothetical protein
VWSPQIGVLSPLLWGLVVDDLREFNNDGYYMVGYPDGIATLIYGNFPQTLSRVL